MRRLTDETTPLLSVHVGNANTQERQLTRPGVLNPLYLIFPTLKCISQFLPMNTLLSFRLADRQLNDASEKAFLYWVSLKILRDLQKIPDQENTLNVIIPRYLRCYILKTIHLQPEFKNFISGSANMDEFSGKLFLSQPSESTIELAEKQKHFIQLCRDIGSTPEGKIKCDCPELICSMMLSATFIAMLGIGCGTLASAVIFYRDKNMQDSTMFGTLFLFFSFIFFGMFAIGIKTLPVFHVPTIASDIYDPRLILSTCSARLFQRIADTAQTVSVPVNWVERLSIQPKAAGKN